MNYWSGYDESKSFSNLLGKTLTSIVVNDNNDEIRFTDNFGDTYLMYHDQSCCESVNIESIVDDLNDLIGCPILLAEEVFNNDPLPEQEVDDYNTFT